MFVIGHDNKVIYDMRHYTVYPMSHALLICPLTQGFALPLVLAEFHDKTTCQAIAAEIKGLLSYTEELGPDFLYKVPKLSEKGEKVNE